MQNDRVTGPTRLRAPKGSVAACLLAIVLAASSLLAGCSGDSEPESDGTSGSAGSTPYLPVPSGVHLTEQGSQLSLGDHAVVAYHPRQGQVAALDIAVTRLEKTSIDAFSAWQLTSAQQRSTPYYVHARIKNVGDTNVGGRPVPLYVVNEDNVLLEATPFASSFKPCPSTPFPKRFGPGKTATVCLVYLAPKHGRLVAVSFRPEETFNPIIWKGEVQRYQPPQKSGGKKAAHTHKGGNKGGNKGTRHGSKNG